MFKEFNCPSQNIFDALREVSEKFGRKNPPVLEIKIIDYPTAGMSLSPFQWDGIRITSGLIKRFSILELKTIFAHEIGHMVSKFWNILTLLFISFYVSSGLNLISYPIRSLLIGNFSINIFGFYFLIFVLLRRSLCLIGNWEEFKCDELACKKTDCRTFIKVLEKFEEIEQTEFPDGPSEFEERLKKYVYALATWPWYWHPSIEERIKMLGEKDVFY
ncbi:MAG: M48 family metalloprotease [Candidatus Hydrothermarchaeales archaeon]